MLLPGCRYFIDLVIIVSQDMSKLMKKIRVMESSSFEQAVRRHTIYQYTREHTHLPGVDPIPTLS